MVKSPDETSRSSAIDTGSGKLQLRNDRALVQVRTVLSARSSSMAPELKNALRAWIEEEGTTNKQTMGYSLAWKRLIQLVQQDETLKTDLLTACDEFKAYVEGVESGIIVPSPTPPPVSTIVSKGQHEVRGKVGAAIYGRRRPSSAGIRGIKPAVAANETVRNPSGKANVGNGGHKE